MRRLWNWLQGIFDTVGARIRRWKERLGENSGIRVKDDDPENVIITIPKTDFPKELGSSIAATIIMGWFLALPAIMAISMIDVDEILAEYEMSGIHWEIWAFLLFLGPFYFLLSAFRTAVNSLFYGYQEVRINELSRKVAFYDSLTFSIFGFKVGGPTEEEADTEKVSVKLRGPIKFLGVTVVESCSLRLIMDKKKFPIADRRNNKDTKKAYRLIKKHLKGGERQ
jgi:hypothetical protein